MKRKPRGKCKRQSCGCREPYIPMDCFTESISPKTMIVTLKPVKSRHG